MKFETIDVAGLEGAVTSMRNSGKSYYHKDSFGTDNNNHKEQYIIGPHDYELIQRLWYAGTEHRKFLRMIQVWVDIGAPRYFWAEGDTYKIGTVANSESTMHKILEEDLTIQNFDPIDFNVLDSQWSIGFRKYLDMLQNITKEYQNNQQNKQYYLQLLKSMLPESFIQKRTVCLNYEVLATMYKQRKNHALPQWNTDFVNGIFTLPYSELITGKFDYDVMGAGKTIS